MERKSIVFCGVNDVLADYMGGMIDRYGWPPRWGNNLREMYAGMVDFDRHFKVSVHAPFLLGLRPIEMSQMGAWAIHMKTDKKLVYVTTTRQAGIEQVIVERWLRAMGYPPAEVVCAGGMEEKLDYLLKTSKFKDMVVESKREFLAPLYDKAAPVVIVLDAPWNRGVQAHRRVHGWRELSTWFVDDKWAGLMDEMREGNE